MTSGPDPASTTCRWTPSTATRRWLPMSRGSVLVAGELIKAILVGKRQGFLPQTFSTSSAPFRVESTVKLLRYGHGRPHRKKRRDAAHPALHHRVHEEIRQGLFHPPSGSRGRSG